VQHQREIVGKFLVGYGKRKPTNYITWENRIRDLNHSKLRPTFMVLNF